VIDFSYRLQLCPMGTDLQSLIKTLCGEKRLTYVHPTRCMQPLQYRSATVCSPVVIDRCSFAADTTFTTALNRYAFPAREWKLCKAEAHLEDVVHLSSKQNRAWQGMPWQTMLPSQL